MSTENQQPPQQPNTTVAPTQDLDATFAAHAARKGIARPGAQPAAAPGPLPSDPQTAATPSPHAKPQAAGDAPVVPPAAEPPADKKESGRTPEELLSRIASKDALYQKERNRARELEQQLQQERTTREQLLEGARSDLFGWARQQGIRIGDQAAAHLTKVKGDDKQAAAALDQAAIDKLVNERIQAALQEARTAEQAELQQQQQHRNQVQVVTDFFKDRSDYLLLNELGKHGQVLERVKQHVGQYGEFADDREAAEVLEYYAREIERGLQAEYEALLAKPGLKSFLSSRLGGGTQKAATPARQEIEGSKRGDRNGAEPLTNDLGAERSGYQEPNPLDLESARRRTVQEMSAIAAAARR